MKASIGVVGAGNWGTTVAKILGENNKHTLLWAHEEATWREINERHQNSRYLAGYELPPTVEGTGDLQRLCTSCDLIFTVVPSHVMRSVAAQMGEFLHGGQMVVHCTKGIEIETFKRMSEVLREETCLRKIGVLAGPNLAKELSQRQPAGTVVSSKYEEVVAAAQAALNNHYFRVYAGRDVVGAEVGGAFKNIVAVAAGIADGLKMGDNTKALLLTRGLNEMARLGAAMGADLVTFGGMAGIGDLMATCFSPLSRNHQVGERLAQGQTLAEIQQSMFMVAEGVKTSRAVHRYATRHNLELPIVQAVHGVLFEGQSVAGALAELMARQAGSEFDGLVLRSE